MFGKVFEEKNYKQSFWMNIRSCPYGEKLDADDIGSRGSKPGMFSKQMSIVWSSLHNMYKE